MNEQKAEKKIKEICRTLEENGGNAEKVVHNVYNAVKNREVSDRF